MEHDKRIEKAEEEADLEKGRGPDRQPRKRRGSGIHGVESRIDKDGEHHIVRWKHPNETGCIWRRA